MNVNIVTVYQSNNYGSFLQAKTLQEIIGEQYPCYLVDASVRNPWKLSYYPAIRGFIKGLLTGNIKYAQFNYKKFKCLERMFSSVKVAALKNTNGCYVFGSDEIWNLDRREMGQHPVLWGEGIVSECKLSYAPSINNCREETLMDSNFSKEIQEFNALSARDTYTCNTIKKITGSTIPKVLDPTMLKSKFDYMKEARCLNKSGYIAVYVFEPSPEIVNVIRSIAKTLNKKVISLGLWYSWCDEVVVHENPFEYYINADYVITNTFHGTAFAINLEKQFVSYANKKKIEELLDDYGLKARDVRGKNSEQIIDLLHKNVEYGSIASVLKKRREDSLKYLFDALKACNYY